jgi:hypothetical protein
MAGLQCLYNVPLLRILLGLKTGSKQYRYGGAGGSILGNQSFF